MVVRSLFIMLMVLSISPGQAAGGNRRTDLITLYNGDKVTGEVKRLFAGRLEVSTDFMGTINVEWQQINSIESLYRYEVRLSDGKRLFGKIGATPHPGELIISDESGEKKLSTLSVVEIRPVSKSIQDRIEVYFALGYSYTKASSLGQGSLNADVSYETDRARNGLTGRLYVTDTNTEAEVTRSGKVDLKRSVWTSREATFRYVMGSYETNDELELDYRISGGGGLGRQFISALDSTWDGAIGAQVLTEKSIGGNSQESMEAVLYTGYSTWRYTTPELRLKLSLSIFPGLTENGRVRADSDVNIRWEMFTDFYWDFTAFGTYDNNAADDSQFDYGISTGVGWEY